MDRKRSLLAAIACAALVMPATTRADWLGTKWGMTPEQVKKAVQELTDVDGKADSFGNRILFIGHYNAGNLKFTTLYQFNRNNDLISISMELDNYYRYSDLYNDLLIKYRKPVSSHSDIRFNKLSSGDEYDWNDKKLMNKVKYVRLVERKSCMVLYSKLDSDAIKGL